jgi:FkbM family methyltransferase
MRRPLALRLGQALELWRCLRHARRPLAVLRRYLALGGVDYPFDLRLRSGLAIAAEDRHDVATAWVVFFRREYRVPRGARAVLDVGANLGAFSLWAARRAPAARIVAVEPFPATFARLAASVHRNGLADRVVCRELGVAATAGTRAMSGAAPSPARSLAPLDGHEPPAAARVAVVSFAELVADACARLGAEYLDYVKVDVEGAEHEALLAAAPAALAPVRALGLEYHGRGDKRQLFAHLEAAGLRLVHDRVFGRDVGVAHFLRDGRRDGDDSRVSGR